MEDETFKYTKEQYKALCECLRSARAVCAPDVYQYRQNLLIEKVTEFLLQPYYASFKNDESEDE